MSDKTKPATPEACKPQVPEDLLESLGKAIVRASRSEAYADDLEVRIAGLEEENRLAHALAVKWHQAWLLFSGKTFDKETWLAEYMKVFKTEERIASLEAQLHNWENREAAACPDGVRFDDFIVLLQAKLKSAQAERDDARRANLRELLSVPSERVQQLISEKTKPATLESPKPQVLAEDLRGLWADAQIDSSKPWCWMQLAPSRVIALVERITSLDVQLAETRNALAHEEMERDIARDQLKAAQVELRAEAEQERVADEEGEHYFSPDGMIAHDAEVRQKAMQDLYFALGEIDPAECTKKRAIDAIRALIDKEKP